MSIYADFIKALKSISYDKYAAVSSREKLVVYAISYLRDNNIPLTFNNICIATYRLFPEKFYFSEEFKEYPHIEMLNRTILHLRPIERNYASGSVRDGYELTPLGEEVARQVKTQIEHGVSNIGAVAKVIDSHKKTSENDLRNLMKSQLYNDWLQARKADEMEIWAHLGVTPYTQIEKIKSDIKAIRDFAKSKDEKDVVDFLDYIKSQVL